MGQEDREILIHPWVVRFMHEFGSSNFKKIQKLGIHPGQLPVLGFIDQWEGTSLREMADKLHIKPPTVTVTVQRLERTGLVYRRMDERDQRVFRIYLTEKGKDISKKLKQLVEENERTMIAGFSEDELEQLKNFLKRMSDNLASEK